MTENLQLKSIGKTRSDKGRFWLEIDKPFRQGLTGLQDYGYLTLIWWGHLHDKPALRAANVLQKPYVNGPNQIGTFATRAEIRPNPILLTVCYSLAMDVERGIIDLAWIDAADGTPLLDIKPYMPASDRVESCPVPDWCSHWPASVETSGDFDWSSEFNF